MMSIGVFKYLQSFQFMQDTLMQLDHLAEMVRKTCAENFWFLNTGNWSLTMANGISSHTQVP